MKRLAMTAESRLGEKSQSQKDLAMAKVSVVGVIWYRREDYSRVIDMCEDSNRLPVSYDQWLNIAERALKDYEEAGFFVIRAVIDPDTFPEWCYANGLNINSIARIEFTNREALRRCHQRN
jgi:hypothetical protein